MGSEAKVIMCSDSPIRNIKEYKQIRILTHCCGPLLILAHSYQGLMKEVRPFYPSFNARAQDAPTPNKSEYFKREGASIAILRQIAERG